MSLLRRLLQAVRSPRSLRARVCEVQPSRDSAAYARVVVEIRNDGSRPASVHRYRVLWPGGCYEARPRRLRLAGGAQVVRTARITHEHGDIAALLRDPAAVRAEL